MKLSARLITIVFLAIVTLSFSSFALAKKDKEPTAELQTILSLPMIPLNGYSATGNQHRCLLRNLTDQPIDFVLTFFTYPDATVVKTFELTALPLTNHGIQHFNYFDLSCKIEWIGSPGDIVGNFCLYQAATRLYNCAKME